jgi:hypothetical protein
VRTIATRAELLEVIRGGTGYLYNAFPSKQRNDCPVHRIDCEAVRAMLDVKDGKLAIPKLWSGSVTDLVREIRRQGLVFEYCQLEDNLP